MATLRTNTNIIQQVGSDIQRLREDFDFHNHVDSASQAVQKKGVSRVTRIIESHTGGVSSPKRIYDQESNNLFINEGAAAEVYFNLPPAFPGLTYTFAIVDSDGLRIVANGTNRFIVFSTTGAQGGYVRATAIGNTITITAINNTTWFATAGVGTWIVSI
jgi:hypothetical protein